MGHSPASMLDWVGVGATIAICSTFLGAYHNQNDRLTRYSFLFITAAGLVVMGVGTLQLLRR